MWLLWVQSEGLFLLTQNCGVWVQSEGLFLFTQNCGVWVTPYL